MRFCKKTIFVVFSVLLSLGVVAPAFANILHDIDKAVVDKEWNKADLLLQRVIKKYKNPKVTFSATTSRAWLAVQMGDWGKARQLLQLAKRFPVKKSQEEIAALNDVALAVSFSGVAGLPALNERIVIGGEATSFSNGFHKTDMDIYGVVNETVSDLMKGFMNVKKASAPFSVPVPPRLEKGEFEKTNTFIKRVEVAEKKYKARIKIIKDEYLKRINIKQSKLRLKEKQLPEMRRFYTQWVMNAAFGSPTVSNVKYDADYELFHAQITVKNEFGNVLSHRVAIEVPFDEARGVKPDLTAANPMLVYKIGDSGLLLTHIFLQGASRAIYSAKISDDTVDSINSYQVATIDVSDMMAQSSLEMVSMINGLSASVTSVSFDPEIRKLEAKIKKAKSKKMEKERNAMIVAKLTKELNKYTATAKKQYFDDLEAIVASMGAIKPDQKKYAVVIGIEEYAETVKVDFAERSAKTFTQIAIKTLGVPEDHIYTLTNSQATAGKISLRIKDYAQRVPAGGVLYFYYAGHGIPAQSKEKTGQPFILPYDLEPAYIHMEERMNVSNIWRQLTAGNKGKVVAFMDSCFSGNTDNNLLFEGVAPGLMRRVDPELPNNKILVYTAGNSHQFANYYPKKGHRLFSYYLFKGLIENKQQSALALQDYIQVNVSKQSRKMGPAYEQTPQLKGNVDEGVL